MDLLKQEVLKRRKALSEEVGGRKIFNRAELEKKRLQKLREEERLELAAKHAASAKTSSPSVPTTQSTPVTSSSSVQKPTPTPEEARIDEMNLPKPEVIRRLRFLKQPITLFGEDDAARLERLKLVLKAGTFEVDSDMTEGQTNDFLRDIAELKKVKAKKRARDDMEEGEREGGEEEEMGGEGGGDSDDEETKRMMRGNLEDLCGEDKILVFFKRLLNEWKEEFNEMGVLQRMTAKEKKLVATFQQCERYLKPLFKFCKKKVLPDDIRQALLVVVECCLKRDYLAAMDQYIKLSIGNAPWPIGVTMVGIHERSAREKIHTNSVAHIMNDETTRKYLQSIKRLMTFCQRRYPTMPSKAVEFNSLANGSDLQSLLAEEKDFGGTRPSEERLRLMPAVKDS